MDFNRLTTLSDIILTEETSPLDKLKTLEDLDHYIDSRIQKTTGLGSGEDSDAIYAVIPSSTQGNLTVFEITSEDKGGKKTYATKRKGQITPDGDLISSPIIKGNVVVYGVMKDDNSTGGEIRELPSGNKIGQFGVSPPAPGFTYRKLMGGEEGDIEGAPPIPMGTPQQIPLPLPEPTAPAEPVIQAPPPVPTTSQQDIELTAKAAAKQEYDDRRKREKIRKATTDKGRDSDKNMNFNF